MLRNLLGSCCVYSLSTCENNDLIHDFNNIALFTPVLVSYKCYKYKLSFK